MRRKLVTFLLWLLAATVGTALIVAMLRSGVNPYWAHFSGWVFAALASAGIVAWRFQS